MNAFDQSASNIDENVERMSHVPSLTNESSTTAVVVENVVTSIVGGMSKSNKEIVLDAVQYATTKAGNARRNVEWYEKFIAAMRDCGFPSSQERYGEYQAGTRRLTMDQIGVQILSGLITSAAVGPLSGPILLGLVGKAFESLKSTSEPLELFQRSTRRFNDISFAIVTGMETDDGDVLLAMASVSLKVDITATNVLFWDFNTSSMKIERGENCTILNHRQWRRAERKVDQYLTEQTDAAFAKFDI